MNEDNELLFRVDIEDNDTGKKLDELNEKYKSLITQKKELEKAQKAGKIEAKEYNAAMKALDGTISETKDELGELNKIQKLQLQSQKSAEGSVNQLRANLGLLTIQYNKLSSEEKKSETVGKALQRQIKAISDELKDQEGSLGDARRNVGNYASGLVETNKILGETNKQLEEANKTNKAFGASFSQIDNTFGAFGGKLDGIKGSIDNLKSGLEATKLGFVGLRGAIAATGIGLLIIALTSLYSWFTKTQEGLDFIERKTAAVTKVFQYFSDKAVSLGKSIFDNPIQALKDLGGVILDQVINRFTAFYKLAVAVVTLDFRKMGEGALQLATGVENAAGKLQKLTKEAAAAAAAGEKIAIANQQIRRSESELTLDREKSRATIEKLKKASEDVTKSTKARETAARQAAAIEEGLLKRQLALQERKIQLLEGERVASKRTDEQRAAINEAKAEYFRIQGESLGLQTELQNSINSIAQEAADKSKAAADAAKARFKEQLQLAADVAQHRLDIAKLTGKDTLALEVDLIRKQGAVQKAGYEKSAAARKLVEEETNAKILDLRVKHGIEIANAIRATEIANAEAQLALLKEGSEEEFKLRKELIRLNAEAAKEALEQSATQTKEGIRLLNAQRLKIDAEAKAALIKAEKEHEEKRVALRQEANERITALDRKMQDDIQKNRDKAFKDFQSDIERQLLTVAEGSNKELELRKKAINARRNAEIEAAKGNQKQIALINAKADKEILDTSEDVLRKKVGKIARIVDGVGQSLTGLIQSNIDQQTRALDKQQEEALKSASLTAAQREAIEKDFQKKKENLEREAAKKRKAIASIENVINTAKAVTVALTSGFDPVTRAISVALAVATGAAQQVIIDSQQFAKGGVYDSKGQGGYVRGPGTTTSDSINARLSDKESVNNARSTEMFYDLYSYLNTLGGGNAYPDARSLSSVAAKASPSVMSGYSGGGVSTINEDSLAAKIGKQVGRANEKLPTPVIGRDGIDQIGRVQKEVQELDASNDF